MSRAGLEDLVGKMHDLSKFEAEYQGGVESWIAFAHSDGTTTYYSAGELYCSKPTHRREFAYFAMIYAATKRAKAAAMTLPVTVSRNSDGITSTKNAICTTGAAQDGNGKIKLNYLTELERNGDCFILGNHVSSDDINDSGGLVDVVIANDDDYQSFLEGIYRDVGDPTGEQVTKEAISYMEKFKPMPPQSAN